MKYEIDFTKPVQTRDGKPVKIISTDGHPNCPIVGYIENRDVPVTWNPDGKFCSGAHESEIDLINVPQKRTLDVWVNVYPNNEVFSYSTKETADKLAGTHRLACIHIVREYEEGEGLQ